MSTLGHLAKRFVGSLGSHRPSPSNQSALAALLSPDAAELFFAQPAMDQAHAIDVALAVRAVVPERTELIRAALLHDVGKRHAGLRVFGRSLATLLGMLRLPKSARARSYLDHGRLGAADLERIGEKGIVPAFASGHHGNCPEGVDRSEWEILTRADNGAIRWDSDDL
jgi:hypothetical protein